MNPDLMVAVERGREAKELVESPAFTSTINDLSAYFLAQIVSCPIGDDALPAMREAHLMHTALGEIVSHLQARISGGEQAQVALETIDEDEDL